jgi:hypothetical protein
MPGIEWSLVARIVEGTALLLIGAWVNRRFESRPVLYSYFGHVAAFKYTPPGGQQIDIYTHSVVVSNQGRRPATNVRLNHRVLPDFNIYPTAAYSIQPMPDGTSDIVIPSIVPGEALTISYLYFPPVTWNQVNAGIKFDEGFARQIPMLLQRQYRRWVTVVSVGLALVGLVAVVYAMIFGIRALTR